MGKPWWLMVAPGDIIGLTIKSDPDVDGYFYPLVNATSSRLVMRDVLAGGTIDLSDAFTGTLPDLAPALQVSVVSVLQVSIDIKPGSYPNSINLSSAGVVPVAILSSATFDATRVDPASVTLAGARVKLIGKGSKYNCWPEDVNGDGRPDLVCHVITADFLIEPGDSTAVLEATTLSGQPIRGEDSIRIVKD